jgi:membrane-associated protease RseP (regulator of RpoE activity)
LPALDGGYLALLAVEAVRGKRLDKEVEQAISASGVLLLLLSGVALVVRDTAGLLGGGR